ncbi:ABC transporter ATP-binding protein [Yinghuangia sp. ASG 101]|uniref:ABC transporter ATP-binding protein n=1 Tax=Yinghuangia sp. ASG 101 TaxID=2896848 RepID=UPI001E46B1F2|nr:ABC transporter ATP-binding protein [Yinghuangia sp. ASG 101]UGQ12083.1 ABC transporter ATP-binding protein [Yinghuangia sp. ASG 101]
MPIAVAGAEAAKESASVAARVRGLVKEYGAGGARVVALDGVDLDVFRGELTAIMGPSGSGKSTLMHCLAALAAPDRGDVWIGGTAVSGLDDDGTSALRRDRIGFVFQAFNLVPTLTVSENVTLPSDLAGRRLDRAYLGRVIEATGLAGRLAHRPAELSGGQQQRVAVARALAARPEIVFADEPTGNLDSRARGEILDLLREGVDTLGQTVVMVTHDPTAAAYADRVVFLADGRIAGDMRAPTADAVLDRMMRFDARTGGTSAGAGRDGAGTRPGRRRGGAQDGGHGNGAAQWR